MVRFEPSQGPELNHSLLFEDLPSAFRAEYKKSIGVKYKRERKKKTLKLLNALLTKVIQRVNAKVLNTNGFYGGHKRYINNDAIGSLYKIGLPL